MSIGRNDPCWCGSGLKYKKCHLDFDNKIATYAYKGFEVPDFESIRTIKELEGIRASAKINTAVLDMVAQKIHVGMSTGEIDRLIHDFTISHGAIPADLNYEGYPKSVCTSINNEICHGIPSDDIILKEGDIVNVDVSTIYKGFYSDASRMFTIGQISPERQRLVTVAKECLDAGLATIRPWGFLGDVGAAIQEHAEANGYSVVTKFGGHGCGVEFHEEPFVAHVGQRGTGCLLVPGMTFTVEPMINQGVPDLFIDEDNGWTVYTADGKDSAQWEHFVLITEDGYEILSY
ncbi:MAG: methionyl aminopeptidase [Peptococcaceae bacterium]